MSRGTPLPLLPAPIAFRWPCSRRWSCALRWRGALFVSAHAEPTQTYMPQNAVRFTSERCAVQGITVDRSLPASRYSALVMGAHADEPGGQGSGACRLRLNLRLGS